METTSDARFHLRIWREIADPHCRLPAGGRGRLSTPATHDLAWHALGLPAACGTRDAGSRAGWRLTHAFQQVFQDHGIVVMLVFGGEKQRKVFPPAGQSVEFIERFRRRRRCEFLEIAFAESQPTVGTRVEPPAKFAGGSKVA